MIRKSKKLRCFTGIKSFPLAYEANREAKSFLTMLKAGLKI